LMCVQNTLLHYVKNQTSSDEIASKVAARALEVAAFSGDLHGADLAGAIVKGCYLRNCNLSNVDLSRSSWLETSFGRISFDNASLRGASFLWANDLSAPDKVIEFGNIPLISFLLGEHISLFNLTAVITSFLISIYSMSMTPDQSNPVLKYMPYIFPIFLLFIFNRLPSALTWYYTVSNVITLILQFVIQNYIIDHDKILAKIAENRKKPKTKSKWQERMEQMQEQQKRMREAQQKNNR